MGDEKQNPALRRLFEGLERRIGGIVVEIVGLVDDGHAVGRSRRRFGEEFWQQSSFVHGDGLSGLAIFGIALKHQQIGMRAGHDLAADPVARPGAQQPQGRVRLGPQEPARGAIGEGGLADPFWADE